MRNKFKWMRMAWATAAFLFLGFEHVVFNDWMEWNKMFTMLFVTSPIPVAMLLEGFIIDIDFS